MQPANRPPLSPDLAARMAKVRADLDRRAATMRTPPATVLATGAANVDPLTTSIIHDERRYADERLLRQ